MSDGIKELIADYSRLTEPGILGYFNCIEVTEVVAFKEGGSKVPYNVFSIAVLEERTGPLIESRRRGRAALLMRWSVASLRCRLGGTWRETLPNVC